MGRKLYLSTVIIVTALASLFLAKSSIGALAAEWPRVFIEPAIIGAQPGQQFSLNVTVANAIFLWAYQIYIGFSPEVLEVVSITKGNFLVRSTYNTLLVPKWNNTLGLIQVWESLVAQYPEPPPPEASGSGELFQITFKAKGFGSCVLHLHQTGMISHDGSLIPHTTLDGIFTNLPYYMTQGIQWENCTFEVRIFSNSTVSPVAFDQPQKEIYFNVTGPNGTDGYAMVSIPLMLLQAQTGGWQITIDATPSTPLILSDSNYTFFYIEYAHSTHEIRIVATEAIPEFNLTAILPIIVLLASAFMTLVKKKTGQARE